MDAGAFDRVGPSVCGAEEDRTGEDAPEALHHSPVVRAIEREIEFFEDPGGGVEPYNTALLPDGQSRHPDQNEPVLTVRQSVVGMRRNFEEETAVVAPVNETPGGRPFHRHPADDKRPRAEQKTGGGRIVLLTSSLDSLNLPESPPRDAEWKAPPGTQLRNRFADFLQLLPPLTESLKAASSLQTYRNSEGSASL